MFENRLSKFLAHCGVASRRKCEELIFEGRVTVNGEVVLSPQTVVNSTKDRIKVDEETVKSAPAKSYYLLNKPPGYVCSANKEVHKKIVFDLFPGKERLFTVGRLDKDTVGLLIVTNDGQLSHRIAHPSFEINKEYIVKTGCEIKESHLKKMAEGIYIEGAFVVPKKVVKVRRGTLKIIVNEGKKREVRTLVETAGLKVQELKRTRIGNLSLGNIPEGVYKKLTREEIETIFT